MGSDKTTLYSALEKLQPRNITDIPVDHLDTFLKDVFSSAEVIVNSVPDPPQSKSSSDVNSTSSFKPVKIATDASSLTASTYPPPTLTPTHEELKPHWGKPIKLGAKENPLGLSVYKLPPHDKHGAWFARRSIHQGLPYDKWKRAMKREFAEGISVTGGPGAGAIRGIGAETRLEKQVVQGVGQLEVFLLSAQFPGPTAPRDFVTCLLTSDEGLTELSVPHNGAEKSSEAVPRHHIVVSIPVDHPDAPPRSGMVRGHYESVEMIREISISDTKSSKSAKIGGKENSDGDGSTTIIENTDANPVEWIMITRSDPGGGIPRFMVERGTPGSIAGDAVKFIDWATSRDDFPENEEENEVLIGATEEIDESTKPPLKPIPRRISSGITFEPSGPKDTGVISALTTVVNNYTPTSVTNGISYLLPSAKPSDSTLDQAEEVDDDDDEDDSTTEVSSIQSFASAEQFNSAQEHLPAHMRAGNNVTSSSTSIDQASMNSGKDSDKSSLEKKLAKIEAQREKLEADFQKARERADSKAKDNTGKDSKEAAKAQERLEKEKKRQQERHERHMRKLDAKVAAEQKKATDRARKAAEDDEVTKLRRERDQARRMAEVRRKESKVLEERLGDLQKENTLIIARVIGLSGGQDVINEVKEEMRKGG